MTNILREVVSKHLKERLLRSTLSGELRERHGRRNVRVVAGDTVKVVRGEYNGIEGKVEKVNTGRGSLAIEGIQREKVRGGNVKVEINSSNVVITDLDLDDKYRKISIQKKNEPAEKDADKIKIEKGPSADKRKKRGGKG